MSICSSRYCLYAVVVVVVAVVVVVPGYVWQWPGV